MENFPPNSAKAKAPDAPQREKLQPVTSAETRGRKRGLGRQFKETFFSGSARDVRSYVIEEVLVPNIQYMLSEIMHGTIDQLFNGDRTKRSRTTSSIVSQGMGHVAYNAMSSSPVKSVAQQRALSRQARARHSLDELIIPTRQEAEEVLDRMFDLLSRDGEVRQAHLYELTGIRPEHTDWKWGWSGAGGLHGAKAVRTRQGDYVLVLPEPEPM